MDLTRDQQSAVNLADRLSKSREIGVLSGPAGTGKTTTLKAIIERVGKPLIVAPWARAAQNAKKVIGGSAVAMTAHSWLFLAVEDEKTGRVTFTDRPRSEESPGAIYRPDTNLLIVEEASTLGPRLCEPLITAATDLGLGILFVGDHCQLPPVKAPDEEDFSVFDRSFPYPVVQRIILDEVFRQPKDSVVLRVATDLRRGQWRDVKKILRPLPVSPDVVEDTANAIKHNVDAITLAHRNETRLRLNRLVRQALQIDPMGPPEVGEPLLIRKNNLRAGLYNGEIVTFPGWTAAPGPDGMGIATLASGPKVLLEPSVIGGFGKEPERYILTRREQQSNATYMRCQYGYVITVHASQGGQWDEVTVVLESSIKVMPEAERMRWLYTAVSRAKRSCYIASRPRGEP